MSCVRDGYFTAASNMDVALPLFTFRIAYVRFGKTANNARWW